MLILNGENEKLRRRELEGKQEVLTKRDKKRRRKGDEVRRWGFFREKLQRVQSSGEERDRDSYSYSRMHLAPLCLDLIEF